jgi:hypothetical protein
LNLSLSSLQTGGESSFPLFILGVHTLWEELVFPEGCFRL